MITHCDLAAIDLYSKVSDFTSGLDISVYGKPVEARD